MSPLERYSPASAANGRCISIYHPHRWHISKALKILHYPQERLRSSDRFLLLNHYYMLTHMQGRDKTRVVTFRCPSNAAVQVREIHTCMHSRSDFVLQVYNYLEKTARVVFGPDLVILNPHENFNVLNLSGEHWTWEGIMIMSRKNSPINSLF